MSASVADHSWFRSFRRGLLDEYCLSLVKGLGPREFLARLDAKVLGACEGLGAFAARDNDVLEEHDWCDDHQVVGAARVDGPDGPWTLALEINGYTGTDGRFMEAASQGTRIVSHFLNIKGMQLFTWWEDGAMRTQFESPYQRSGTTPDELLTEMAAVGYDLSDPSADGAVALGIPGMIALAEELTGIRLTADLLTDAVYTAGMVTIA
ncbi:DUF6461 domain-containing protein [Actinocorallia aurea]